MTHFSLWRRSLLTLFIAASVAGLTACGGGSGGGSAPDNDNADHSDPDTSAPDPVSGGDWYQPAPGVSWYWQLSGDLNTGYSAEIYDIDLFDNSAAVIADLQAGGHKVICYFSGGSYEDWRDDAGEFAAADLGNDLDGWEGERWLDIRSANVKRIMQERLNFAVEQGCDGVEPDNMDGYANSNGVGLSAADQLSYNRFIANEAHSRGLAVALKNDLDQVTQLVDYFDFAVNEQCAQYDECDLLDPFVAAGKAVLQAEYASEYQSTSGLASLCNEMAGSEFSTLVLPLDLDDSVAPRGCDD